MVLRLPVDGFPGTLPLAGTGGFGVKLPVVPFVPNPMLTTCMVLLGFSVREGIDFAIGMGFALGMATSILVAPVTGLPPSTTL
jgi:hypothetical protein